ncbi:hypothetical protein BDW62DRAFT_80739 [Aspergillus aurantiobrunneus]
MLQCCTKAEMWNGDWGRKRRRGRLKETGMKRNWGRGDQLSPDTVGNSQFCPTRSPYLSQSSRFQSSTWLATFEMEMSATWWVLPKRPCYRVPPFLALASDLRVIRIRPDMARHQRRVSSFVFAFRSCARESSGLVPSDKATALINQTELEISAYWGKNQLKSTKCMLTPYGRKTKQGFSTGNYILLTDPKNTPLCSSLMSAFPQVPPLDSLAPLSTRLRMARPSFRHAKGISQTIKEHTLWSQPENSPGTSQRQKSRMVAL